MGDDEAMHQATAAVNRPAPEVSYKPQRPSTYRPTIGLIGCGGITKHHLAAYRDAGYNVGGFADLDAGRAEARRDEFFPQGKVHASTRQLLADPSIDVVDIATHPGERFTLIKAALEAGKHVLSQKPFVLDLDEGERLADMADAKGLKLAVNQNGRWAPHVSYLRNAIAAGMIGQVSSVDASIIWNHNWVKGTPFDRIHHLVLYDFAIHWFDMIHCFTPGLKAKRVWANATATTTQTAIPPLLGQTIIEFDHAQASLILRADSASFADDRMVVVGQYGALVSAGPNLNEQTVSLNNGDGRMIARLDGQWFNDGFDGTMSELLCAIEEDRQPSNSGRDNLESLALCFAALEAADTGQSRNVGEVRQAPPTAMMA